MRCWRRRLRVRKATPIERATPMGAPAPASPNRMPTGVKMKLIGWAIALAAAGLTPAAAQGPASSPAPAAASPSVAPAPAAKAPAAIVPGSVGHALPTPGIGEPDGRKGIQVQVTPIGEEAAYFHDDWLLPLCAVISAFVLGLLLY